MSEEQSDRTTVSNRVAREGVEPELPRGSRVDRYVILEVLGKGGMGVVYRAFDPSLNRGVALKLIRTRQDGHGRASHRSTRLLREAQALGQLNHPNVVRVHDVGTVGDNVFVAMEVVEGRTLKAWLRETKSATTEALEVMRAAGRGLAAAHKQGLIHRDFKPDNVIVGEDGRVRVIDFGLARAGFTPAPRGSVDPREPMEIDAKGDTAETRDAAGGSEEPFDLSGSALLDLPMTRGGALIGTPAYMAPEQFLAAQLDARTDQFSFCVVLYEILYGKRPYSGSSHKDIAEEVLEGCVQSPPTDSAVPTWLHHIVVRGLSREPDERYRSMEELLEELKQNPEEVLRQQQVVRRRKLLVIGSVALAVMMPLGLWYGLRIQASQLCQAVEGDLAGVWDGATKNVVRKAFLRTNKSFAEDTWLRVERALDSYASEWTEMRGGACSARWLSGTQSEEVFDLRMGCLSKRLTELSALARVFAEADDEVVAKAAQASLSLTGIAVCADEEGLRAPYPPPKTAEVKARVAAIRGKLIEVGTLKKTGKYHEGLELARKLEEGVYALGYRPVQAEVFFELAELLVEAGQYREAESTHHAAMRVAAESRDGVLAARAMSGLASDIGWIQARYEEGILLSRDAKIVLSLGGGDSLVLTRILRTASVMYWKQGAVDTALEQLSKALGLLERVLGPNDHAVALVQNNMGLMFDAKGEYDKALDHHRKALAIKKKTLGSEHPNVATTLHNMGAVYDARGEYDKMVKYFRDALEILENSLGTEHPTVAQNLIGIAAVFSSQGEYDEALKHLRRALTITDKVFGPAHPLAVWSLYNVGKVLRIQGRYREARRSLERAVSICEKTTCDPEPHGATLFELARAVQVTGGTAKCAVKLAKEARVIFNKTPKPLAKNLREVNAWLRERGVQ